LWGKLIGWGGEQEGLGDYTNPPKRKSLIQRCDGIILVFLYLKKRSRRYVSKKNQDKTRASECSKSYYGLGSLIRGE